MGISIAHRCVFVHIPKNAGTSIVEAFGMTIEGHVPWHEYEGRCFDRSGVPYFRFCVVRDPMSRVVSCYEYARLATSHHHRADGASRAGPHPDHDLVASRSFAECVDLLARRPESFRHPGWRAQHPFVVDERGTARVDAICRFEHLATDLAAVCEQLGTTVEVGHLNRSAVGRWEERYDERTRAIVSDLFEEDLSVFGYDDSRRAGQRAILDALCGAVAHASGVGLCNRPRRRSSS